MYIIIIIIELVLLVSFWCLVFGFDDGDFWVKVKNLAVSGFPLFYVVSGPFGVFYQFVFVLVTHVSEKLTFWELYSLMGLG